MKKHALPLLLLFTTASAMQQQAVVLTPDKIATFKIVQKIYECAKETAQELNETCELGMPDSLQLDPTLGQTQQGLRLIVRVYPRFIESPWGLVTLFTTAAHHNPHCFDTPKETLFRKIGHPDKFCPEKLSSWPYKNKNDAYLKNTLITQRNLSLPCGHIILSQLQKRKEYLEENPGNAYIIDVINNETCPTALTSSCERYRDTPTIMSEWQALEDLAKNNYLQTTPQSTKSPKTTRKTPKTLTTPPLLAMLPTTAPSDPTSPKSSMLPKLVSIPQTQSLPSSPRSYGSFNLVTSPTQSQKTSPCSPEEQEYSRLLPLSEAHTPDSNCSCKCLLM